jgi:NADH-quinone oxidoreductase subunit L
MTLIVQILWLIPILPLLAAGVTAFSPQPHRRLSSSLAIIAISGSFLLSIWALCHVLWLRIHGLPVTELVNFNWFQSGNQWVRLGWMLDPLTAVMLVMVTFITLLVLIYSTGYMHDDTNFTRFFCFLSLFAGAMLGLVIANSLLLLFMCWEVVGLTSYLLIGFWYQKPSAVAAAKKAFIVTRIGDLALFLGIVWLAGQAGTLLFYDHGAGFLDPSSLARLTASTTIFGLSAATGIALLIFCGAIGKSGQVPLHVWLPDAMEGPTPVSALIHAATMVAAGVFLIARVYPLMSAHAASAIALTPTTALQVVTWVGAVTALFGAVMAVAQFDIKRILAYSTISQLGYMMIGLGVGGVAVGVFHLITHACFKALLFLGAGSVIHGCFGEQDIRRMGGLRKFMPITFVTYMVGMLALCGFPFFFSGFWSKDEILHAAHTWNASKLPFYIGAFAALLTAFYMTRQVYFVFAGKSRLTTDNLSSHHAEPHESPRIMTAPLTTLAVIVMMLGVVGTPVWPWFHSFLENTPAVFSFAASANGELIAVMLTSSLLVFLGLALGWYFYGRGRNLDGANPDPVEQLAPSAFHALGHGLYLDQIYGATVVRWNAWSASACNWLDIWLWGGIVQALSYLVLALAWLDNFFDTHVVNFAFDAGCQDVTRSGRILSLLQDGRVQNYLRMVGVTLIALVLFLLWGTRA